MHIMFLVEEHGTDTEFLAPMLFSVRCSLKMRLIWIGYFCLLICSRLQPRYNRARVMYVLNSVFLSVNVYSSNSQNISFPPES